MNNHAMNASMKEACAVEIQLEELFKLACVDSPMQISAIGLRWHQTHFQQCIQGDFKYEIYR